MGGLLTMIDEATGPIREFFVEQLNGLSVVVAGFIMVIALFMGIQGGVGALIAYLIGGAIFNILFFGILFAVLQIRDDVHATRILAEKMFLAGDYGPLETVAPEPLPAAKPAKAAKASKTAEPEPEPEEQAAPEAEASSEPEKR